MNFVKRRILLMALGIGLSLGWMLQAQSLDALKASVKEKTLTNGMKFIVMERHDAPVASFHVYADVGAAQELGGITGISHILEHMAFKGTTTVGTKDWKKEKPILDELDRVYAAIQTEDGKIKPDPIKLAALKKQFDGLQDQAKALVVNNEYIDLATRQGDLGLNAYTNSDATQYINSLPQNKLEFWMALTSDRFMNPVFREFYKERDVIMEERRLRTENQPIGRLIEDFLATAFKAHPYHHPVVGHMSDLQKISHQDVVNYFKKYYSPNNLTVAIVGDVKAEDVFVMAEKYFGRIPSGPKPDAIRTQEPPQWGERTVTVRAQSQPLLLVGYKRPMLSHEDNDALDALSTILGQGHSSRLYEALVKREKVAIEAVGIGYFPGNKYTCLIGMFVVPAKDKSNADCQALIEKEIAEIQAKGVTEEELKKYKNNAKKQILDQLSTNASTASLLTQNEILLGSWKEAFDGLKKLDRLTTADIQRVAKTYLVKNQQTIANLIQESK